LRKDGTRIDVSLSICPVRDASGHISGLSSIVRDITARIRAEEAITFLADASAGLAASLDFEATVRTVAQVAVPFLADLCIVHALDEDRTLREVAVANERRELAGFLEPLRQQTFDLHGEHPFARLVRTGESRLVGEITPAVLGEIALNPEHLGLLRAMRLRSLILVPIVSAGGVVGAMGFGVCGPGRRYTALDLALAEALARRAGLAIENARLYREAQAAIRLRNQVLSTVSHDVRNELAAISLTVEALQLHVERQGMPDATRLARDLAKIERAAAKTTGLVSHILDVGRLQAGQKLNIQRRPCDLVALARRLADEHQQMSQVHRIRVEARAPALVGLWDAARLERAVSNVLDNALRYSPQGGEVVVEVVQVAGETETWAELVVRDQGLGIPASELPRIFDWFYRGSNVDERIAGSGVGLASARQIIEQHGGTISATCGDAGGAAFIIRLPLAAAAHTEERPMVHQRGSRRKRGSMPRPTCGDGDISPQSGPAA
ncbi:MAG: GAF domain-containing protein, partial [Chloroflexi bacterium]|nr:GAF domain-containing protein [Chloroflexota bacterium]